MESAGPWVLVLSFVYSHSDMTATVMFHAPSAEACWDRAVHEWEPKLKRWAQRQIDRGVHFQYLYGCRPALPTDVDLSTVQYVYNGLSFDPH